MSRGKTENLFHPSLHAMLKDRWSRTGDRETLAQFVEASPPFGDAEVGAAVAAALRDKRPDQKAELAVTWREIDRLFRWMTVDVPKEQRRTHTEAYEVIGQIYFNGERDAENLRKQHTRWANKPGQSF